MSFFEFVRDLAATHPDPDPFLCLVLDAEGGIMTSAAHGEWETGDMAACLSAALRELRPATAQEMRTSRRTEVSEAAVAVLRLEQWHAAWTQLPMAVGRARHLAVVRRASEEDPHNLGRLTLYFAHAAAQAWTSCERTLMRKSQCVIQRMRKKLQEFEKVSALAQLCAGIAHEIRNPLTTARGFLQLFAERCDAKDRAYLELTISELDRIRELLEDFMGLCRPDREEAAEIDMAEIARSVHRFLVPEASLCDIAFELHVPDHPVRTAGRPAQIKQVLINLVQNALQACRGQQHAAVKLEVDDEDDRVRVNVVDNGCGIEHMDRIFRPFYTTKSTGTGLGLFVCKHIVESHGGAISVRSQVGAGTTVTVEIPKCARRA
ncbi:histidine kinase [Alicyclobacillus acidocaldarius subsp. acidocaldarius Tc-4-1]|uniref:histidine kinase n=2 Tax=Alicyclobacillus acidocaldarius TaxID=405212 RepID=F8IEF5_ALIAT|nr:histidine kinase [Alicyclobacillus acidocaldarius subsp. acidocaldarius Tc-4-1]